MYDLQHARRPSAGGACLCTRRWQLTLPMYDGRCKIWGVPARSARGWRRVLVVMIFDANKRSYQSMRAFALLIDFSSNAFALRMLPER